MRKLIVSLLVLGILCLPVLAGEHQAESMEYERAFAAGQYPAAYELAETGVGQGNALNAIGLGLYEDSDFAGAKSYLVRAIVADPEQFWAHNTLGAILLYEGDVAGAIVEFEKHVAANLKASDSGAAARVEKGRANIRTANLYL